MAVIDRKQEAIVVKKKLQGDSRLYTTSWSLQSLGSFTVLQKLFGATYWTFFVQFQTIIHEHQMFWAEI